MPHRLQRTLHILSVDDDANVLDVIASLFRVQGHQVETAADGAEALAKVSAAPNSYDLIVTDVRMPNLGGIGLMSAAFAAGFRGQCIVFSASFDGTERAAFEGLGVTEIIAKPNLVELAATVRRLFPAG